MLDARPCHLGDVQEPVNAAKVHERAVVRDVADLALADHSLAQPVESFVATLGTLFLDHLPVREDDLLLTAICFDDAQAQRPANKAVQIPNVARADLRRRHKTTDAEIDSQPALDSLRHHRGDDFAGVK